MAVAQTANTALRQDIKDAEARARRARLDTLHFRNQLKSYRHTHSVHNLIVFVGFVLAVAAFFWALTR